jgi:ADP-heptose:LPS heptosyltransferase/SAM-dependent methyltransferase
MKKILIRLKHGLGDVVQLSIVLKHIRHYWPDTEIDVEVQSGMHNIFGPLANTYPIGKAPDKQRDAVYNLDWRENIEAEGHCPSTKVTRCLKEVFHLPELSELYEYEVHIPKDCKQEARRFYKTLPDAKGYVVIHYQGRSSTHRKNLDDNTVRWLCEHLVDKKYIPIILDWDRLSPVPDDKNIFRADHKIQKNAGTIAALISQADLFVGIDSGPLHIAGGLKTPTIGVWTLHHPTRYFDISNVLHLVPSDARRYIRMRYGNRANDYFHGYYRHEYYNDLDYSVVSNVCKQLRIGLPTGNPMEMSFLLTSTAYDEKYYQEHKSAGLDYAAYGAWQQNYATWLAEGLDLRGKRVLDIGCACGAITHGLVDTGVNAIGTDVNEYMVRLGQDNWDRNRLFVCDCINLHLFENNHFDCLHLHQVAEHLRPDYIPLILAELNRVSKTGAKLLLFLDTTELFERQGRHEKDEDPTHVCIKPRSWWRNRLELAGWSDHTEEDRSRLAANRLNFFKQYDWEFLSFHKQRNLK